MNTAKDIELSSIGHISYSSQCHLIEEPGEFQDYAVTSSLIKSSIVDLMRTFNMPIPETIGGADAVP